VKILLVKFLFISKVGDDCALPPPCGIAGRRGLAGTVLVHKVNTWSHFSVCILFVANSYKGSDHTLSYKYMTVLWEMMA